MSRNPLKLGAKYYIFDWIILERFARRARPDVESWNGAVRDQCAPLYYKGN
jgi:hypothetical protein